jgi:two-component system OmpR family response regulator
MRLLIVEDDLVLADALVRALGNAGYAVDHLSCGADADGALIGAVHDLVILDLGLPKMDGFEVVALTRAPLYYSSFDSNSAGSSTRSSAGSRLRCG